MVEPSWLKVQPYILLHKKKKVQPYRKQFGLKQLKDNSFQGSLDQTTVHNQCLGCPLVLVYCVC